MENAPPPFFEKIIRKKIKEKKYILNYNKNEYELIISLFEEKENIIFNFKLISNKNIENNKIIFYENNKNSTELIKLFLINISKCQDSTKKILEKIEKFHTNKNVSLQQNTNSEIINLVYNLKTLDNEDIEFIIELTKKEELIDKEKKELLLNEEIISLKKTITTMKNKYEKIIKEQNDEIQLLKDKIEHIMNVFNIKKVINEEEQLIFKKDLSTFNNFKIINAEIDGTRGVNDHFEVYNLYNEKNSVYVAVKCKEDYSDISYIDIIKITSIDNYKKIKRLKGHQKRIVFIKYFINPYTKQEYLVSGDREEKIRVWEIITENEYKLACFINTNYGRLIMQQSIYNSILYFTQNRNYIYTTTVTNNYSRLYDLENGALIKNIELTYYHYTFYLLKYKDLIVDCCRNNIIIYQPFTEEVYDKIEKSETKGDNRSACIIYNKDNTDYLYISNSNGNIISYDLIKKNIITIYNLNKDLYHIIFWDYKNLIVAEYDTGDLEIIYIENTKNINSIKCNNTIMCVKKILLNQNEEIILASGENTKNLYLLYSSYSINTPLSSNNNE